MTPANELRLKMNQLTEANFDKFMSLLNTCVLHLASQQNSDYVVINWEDSSVLFSAPYLNHTDDFKCLMKSIRTEWINKKDVYTLLENAGYKVSEKDDKTIVSWKQSENS